MCRRARTEPYVDDKRFGGSYSTAVRPASVRAATWSTSKASSLNPSVYGQTVILKAVVIAANSGFVSGTIAFMDGTTALGTAPVDSTNNAALSISTIGAGSHSLTAVYGGSANYSGSTSAALKQTVKQATSRTALSDAINPSIFGNPSGLTATVYSEYGGSVNGTITFMEGTTTLATFPVDPTNNQATLLRFRCCRVRIPSRLSTMEAPMTPPGRLPRSP